MFPSKETQEKNNYTRFVIYRNKAVLSFTQSKCNNKLFHNKYFFVHILLLPFLDVKSLLFVEEYYNEDFLIFFIIELSVCLIFLLSFLPICLLILLYPFYLSITFHYSLSSIIWFPLLAIEIFVSWINAYSFLLLNVTHLLLEFMYFYKEPFKIEI